MSYTVESSFSIIIKINLARLRNLLGRRQLSHPDERVAKVREQRQCLIRPIADCERGRIANSDFRYKSRTFSWSTYINWRREIAQRHAELVEGGYRFLFDFFENNSVANVSSVFRLSLPFTPLVRSASE